MDWSAEMQRYRHLLVSGTLPLSASAITGGGGSGGGGASGVAASVAASIAAAFASQSPTPSTTPQFAVGNMSPERRRATERFGRLQSLVDSLDFIVGAKIGQIAAAPMSTVSSSGNIVGATPRNQSVPSLGRMASQDALDAAGAAGGGAAAAAAAASAAAADAVPENIAHLKQMLHARAAFFGVRNTEVDPLLTPVEIAFHRCHFAMLLALLTLSEVLDILFPGSGDPQMLHGAASPRLASASLRESSVFAIEPLREQIRSDILALPGMLELS